MRPHVHAHLAVDLPRQVAQGQLAESREIAGTEEFLNGRRRLLGDVDFALVQPLDQLIRREIDENDLIGSVQNVIRHGLPDHDACYLGDDVAQTFDMLDVQRSVDVNADREKFFDVLISAGMAGSGGVGVRELIDDCELGPAGEDRVEIQFLEHDPPVLELAPGDHGQVLKQGFGLFAVVRLHQRHDQIDAFGLPLAGGLQHGVGLADPCHVPQEDLELAGAALFLLRLRQQRIGIRALWFSCDQLSSPEAIQPQVQL